MHIRVRDPIADIAFPYPRGYRLFGQAITARGVSSLPFGRFEDYSVCMNVLACPMRENPSGAKNLREFFVFLAAAVWEQGDSFSGKRPWGYSSWDYDVYEALIRAGLVAGSFDEDGFVKDFDQSKADALIFAAFEEFARGTG